MKTVNGYARFVASLALLLGLLSPVIQFAAGFFENQRTGIWPEFDLNWAFPQITAPLLEAHSGTTLGIVLDLAFDLWLWVPALIALLLIGALHGFLASATAR